MKAEDMLSRMAHHRTATQRDLTQSTLSDLPSWIGVLSQVAPILSGVSSFGSFINGVVAARETAAFQQDLLTSLQSIQTTLTSIATELDGIQATLTAIQQEIQDLALADKLTSIENWGISLAALSTDMTVAANLTSAQNLAAAMMDADNGATNLQGCMLSIHNAMVGNDLTSPLITQLTAAAFFQLRGRLVQGLQLLAFATAFNPNEVYDFGAFLLAWSANFQDETQIYLNSTLDTMVPMYGEICTFYNQTASDGIVQYEYLQPTVPNVAFQVAAKDGTLLTVWTDSLVVTPATSSTEMYASTATGSGYAIVDVVNDSIQYTPTMSQQQIDMIQVNISQYMGFDLWEYLDYTWISPASWFNLVCGARVNSAQVFLGGCYGQTLWVESDAGVLVAIFQGTDLTGNMFTYDASSQALSTSTLSDLGSLTGALWNVSMSGTGTITVQPQSQGSANLYLSQDGDGTWSLVSGVETSLSITCPAAVPGTRGNPFSMAATSVMMNGTGTATSVLFYQF